MVTVSKSESGSGREEVVFSEIGYDNKYQVDQVDLHTDSENENQVIWSYFGKGTKTYYPTYYTDGAAIRIYSSQTIRVESPYSNIIGVDFTFGLNSSVTDSNAITASNGTYTEGAASTATSSSWVSGSAMTNSVTFTVGGSSGQRRLVSMTIIYYDAFAFAKDFLNNTVCDDSGVNPPSVNWTDLSNKAAVLFDSEKTYLKTAEANELGNKVEQAVARYDYVVGKYGTDSYTDFLFRDPAPISHSAFTISENNESSVLIILLIATSSLSTLVLLIIKKKKKIQ